MMEHFDDNYSYYTYLMQTFLPYADFNMSAACLDDKRLGKQRVECLQILKALANPKYGWQNHPAVKMWRGWEAELCIYGLTICNEWKSRGFKDTCAKKIMSSPFACGGWSKPSWFGNEAFHASHRSNLLRKDSTHYSQFGWTEPNNLPYVWPV